MFGSMSHETLALLVVVPALAFFVVKWLFQKDVELENRRRGAATLASKLSAYGLVRIPAMLVSYSVGDYVTLVEQGKQILNLFLAAEDGDSQLMNELNGVYAKVLANNLSTAAGRATVQAALTAATTATATSAS